MGCRIPSLRNGRLIGRSSYLTAIAVALVVSTFIPFQVSRVHAADQPSQQQQQAPRQVSDNPGTLELTDLESKFRVVADKVSPCVVAISASVTPVDSDDAVRADGMNGEKLESILERTTRTVGTG